MTDKFSRLIEVDLIRGLAILGVVVFHIVWDLEFTGLISGIAFHPIWLGFGRSLAGTFMFLVGVSLVLAHQRTFKVKAFLNRLSVVVLAAFTISVVTWFAFPNHFIFYGILHAIAAASLVGVLFLRLPLLFVVVAGALSFLLPQFFRSEVFDTRWLAWIGFYENAPPSNDFVPFFPWVGLSILGVAFARFFKLPTKSSSLPLSIRKNPFTKFIAWSGQKSLPIYLVHQPVLLALIVPLSWLLNA
ncbi:heparan-alpha-glucosaminide N-acetyltransferase [Ahrensia marina]|uniref:Heparan-alpha-glucosaminide N-acetyltransferase catalytic domain-containing protein n=1 Tax=Ahrensia marina TaxID=1514904 RepID=A0A0N0E6I3_9HYPH|nr:heparan-alpha-glucosaminide N-acetyltransferase [Ahrensia marina]KPB00051.1 hypothetical protein SU32_15885 [Ahrensia marina]